MVQTLHPPSSSAEPPRISFSADFLDDDDFISISPHSHRVHDGPRNPDFEFLSSTNDSMVAAADQLIFEGKLLPFWQVQQSERLSKLNLKSKEKGDEEVVVNVMAASNSKEEVSEWFVDDDPSPRPPNCTVLWKELLRLKKQRSVRSGEKGLERTRSVSMRIRPMVNVPICTPAKPTSSFPPLMRNN